MQNGRRVVESITLGGYFKAGHKQSHPHVSAKMLSLGPALRWRWGRSVAAPPSVTDPIPPAQMRVKRAGAFQPLAWRSSWRQTDAVNGYVSDGLRVIRRGCPNPSGHGRRPWTDLRWSVGWRTLGRRTVGPGIGVRGITSRWREQRAFVVAATQRSRAFVGQVVLVDRTTANPAPDAADDGGLVVAFHDQDGAG